MMKLTTTTIRVDAEVLERFKNAVGMRNMNTTIVDLMKARLKDQGGVRTRTAGGVDSQTLLADLLAKRVTQRLSTDKAWALDVVRTAQLRWPAEGVLGERMAHWPMDKDHLAEKFSAWMGSRIRYILDTKKQNVLLFLDAGSGVLYFCHSLWTHLEELSKTERPGRHITLVSNNLAAAESFAEQCHEDRFMDKTQISFQLLGGTVQHTYAALTGSVTKDSLQAIVKNKTKHDYLISVVAGNYIRLSEHHPAVAIPLIRGEGQKEVKDEYVKSGSEVYLLGASPAKIFNAPNAKINEALELSYKDVTIRRQGMEPVKLVTTLRRHSDSILRDHSKAVVTRLGESNIDPSKNRPDTPVDKLNHFCYEYDGPVSGKNEFEQIKWEFPHKPKAATEEQARAKLLKVIREFFWKECPDF